MRLPCRRPCMSVSASRTVSIRSLVTSVLSWSSVKAGSMPARTLQVDHEEGILRWMRAKPITEHLWQMSRWGVANAYLVREDDGTLTLVDTGFKSSGAWLLAAAAEV